MRHATLLVTGCGRSGTQHTARALSLAGVDMPHESMGADGSVSWYLALDGGAVPSAGRQGKYALRKGAHPSECTFAHRVVQVRHPLGVVASLMTSFREVDWRYVHNALPAVGPVGPGGVTRDQAVNRLRMRRAMLYWLRWNQAAERVDGVRFTYRVEHLAEAWPKLFELLGKPAPAMPRVSTRLNRNSGYLTPPRLTWSHLAAVDESLARNLLRQARRYGYEAVPWWVA